MRPVVGWPIALVLSVLAVSAYINSETLDEWVQDHSITIDNTEPQMIGIQDSEKWLVVLIDFPDQEETANCDQERAKTFFGDAANTHLDQTAGRDIDLEIIFHDRIITTNHAMSTYGHDENDARDVGENGQNPHTLAQQIVEAVKNEIEWEVFDLNDDGWVDRFLILHCAIPQEDGGGSSNRIWSHFSSIDENVDLGNNLQIGHYSIASQRTSTNLGTLIHEMYHQLGAVDLYPVHDETVLQSWKGVGKWDIMASGNWNGNGAWPALPTSPMIEVMGVDRHNDVILDWPVNGELCTGPNAQLSSHGENGKSIKIPIGTSEYVWIEYRTDVGYDSNLPGHGILVLQQDLLSGDIEDNLVNSHPERAWLKVIEADGEQNMIAGNSEGEESDLFQHGDTFGAEGIQIRNRDGVLVDWTANISESGDDFNVEFSSKGCGHSAEIDLPNHGSVLTSNDDIPFSTTCADITLNISSSDGRELTYENGFLKFSEPGVVGVVGSISGTITCDTGTPIDIVHDFEILGNIPIESIFKAMIPYDEISTITIPIEMIGDNSQTWLIGVNGPLERVATTDSTQQLNDGSEITLDIDPEGLLTPGMLVKGELVIASDSGHQWEIEIELVAESEDSSAYEKWRRPGILISIALSLASLWVLMGIHSSSRKVAVEQEEAPTIPIESEHPSFVDPFSETY